MLEENSVDNWKKEAQACSHALLIIVHLAADQYLNNPLHMKNKEHFWFLVSIPCYEAIVTY